MSPCQCNTLGTPTIEALNDNLGLIPDWQFYPAPPPIGTGKFEATTVDLPGSWPSYGICGAMGLGQPTEADLDPYSNIYPSDTQMKWMMVGSIVLVLHSMLRVPLAVVDGVHGYKRNGDDGAAAAGWGALGFLFPLTTTTVALFQGYGKSKKAR